jgi:hypothetical protein
MKKYDYEKIEYPIAIGDRYDIELSKIGNLLDKIEEGTVYEVTGNSFDGTL